MPYSTFTDLQRYSQSLAAHTLLQISTVYSHHNPTDKKIRAKYKSNGSHRMQSYRLLLDRSHRLITTIDK